MTEPGRRLSISTVLLLVFLGTALSSSSVSSRAEDPHRDPACMNICFLNYQTCIFAAQPNRSEMNKCNSEYKHCIAHCK